jgi:hypothetical protein
MEQIKQGNWFVTAMVILPELIGRLNKMLTLPMFI